jgi:hypothetical protein
MDGRISHGNNGSERAWQRWQIGSSQRTGDLTIAYFRAMTQVLMSRGGLVNAQLSVCVGGHGGWVQAVIE